MKAIAMKPLASHLLALGLVALVGPLAASSVQAADSVEQPTPQAILSAIGALQAAVNNLQTSSSKLQSSVQTLQSNLPPAWSQTLPGANRFVPALGGAAELDLETGLVWEQSPNTTSFTNWFEAHDVCAGRVKGGREGWRLPTVQELGSLEDLTQTLPGLPFGHPFSGVQGPYWSATSVIGAATDAESREIATRFAWRVTFDGTGSELFDDKISNEFVWCVRGGLGVDFQ
jgi:hypothetical protein